MSSDLRAIVAKGLEHRLLVRAAEFTEIVVPGRAMAKFLMHTHDAYLRHAPVPPSPTRTSLNAGTPSGVVCPGNACGCKLI